MSESALEILRAWRRRDDNDNGFSKHIKRDAEQVLHAIYDECVAALRAAEINNKFHWPE